MNNQKTKIRVFYERAKDYRLIPVTGVFGGVSPNGESILDFFVERQESPESVEIEVDGSGTVKELSKEGGKIIREKQIGVVMRPDIAILIGEFILSRAKIISKS